MFCSCVSLLLVSVFFLEGVNAAAVVDVILSKTSLLK
jgi:hypothetical protein